MFERKRDTKRLSKGNEVLFNYTQADRNHFVSLFKMQKVDRTKIKHPISLMKYSTGGNVVRGDQKLCKRSPYESVKIMSDGMKIKRAKHVSW